MDFEPKEKDVAKIKMVFWLGQWSNPNPVFLLFFLQPV